MSRIKKISGLLLVSSLVACSSGTTKTANPTTLGTQAKADVVTPTTSAGPTARVAAVGTYGVGQIETTYVDKTRRTDANGPAFPGAKTRTLHTIVVYPAATGKFQAEEATANAKPDVAHGRYPLVIFSHGNRTVAAVYLGNAIGLASAGYVVVLPDYPLSRITTPGGPKPTDVKNQPADASFVLTSLVADNQKLLGGIIDPSRIGAMGHSLGAFTTLGLTYAKCCTDARIGAAISLAGAMWGIDKEANYFTGPNVPVLFFHGDADETVPYKGARTAYLAAKAPKAFITLPGGNHVGPFLGSGNPLALPFIKTFVPWFDRFLKRDVNALDALRTAVANSTGVFKLEEQIR